MFNYGDIVYHDDYVFKDNIKDEKKEDRYTPVVISLSN